MRSISFRSQNTFGCVNQAQWQLRRAHTTYADTTSSSSGSSNEGAGTGTADQSEVEHFSTLASTWWDRNGSSRILHLMNPIRIQFIQRCLGISARRGKRDSSQAYTYLDVGCGGGILSEALARLQNTRSVIGIDPTPAVLEVAKEHLRRDPELLGSGKLKYVNTTIEGVEIPSGNVEGGGTKSIDNGIKEGTSTGKEGFDVVTAMEVIEHVPNPAYFLKECCRRVKPGGWVIGSTIARSWVSYLTTKVVAEGVARIVPWGTHDWGKYVNVEELERWVREFENVGGLEGWKVGEVVVMGCIYVPGLGWREVKGGEKVGNYFFGIRRAEEGEEMGSR